MPLEPTMMHRKSRQPHSCVTLWILALVTIVPSRGLAQQVSKNAAERDSLSPASDTRRAQAIEFEPIYINAGSESSLEDSSGTTWQQDLYFVGGDAYTTDTPIQKTADGTLYQSARHGPSFYYEIPVPNGSFKVSLHFAEIVEEESRAFDVLVKGSLAVDGLSIHNAVGDYAALMEEVPTDVTDGALSIEFKGVVGNAIVSAIEVTAQGTVEPHYAHAVPGGPYFKVDTNEDGKEFVTVDGHFSHTHHPDLSINRWTWYLDGVDAGSGEIATLEVPIGEHELLLQVEDTGGNVASDFTTVTVREFGFPEVAALVPDVGDVAGGEELTITGSGFSSDAIVHLGSMSLTGEDISVVNSNTIKVVSTPPGTLGNVDVSVETSIGTSNTISYTYIDSSLPPVQFDSGTLIKKVWSTTLAFGPDGRLYLGTRKGKIIRLTLDDDHNVIDQYTSFIVGESEPEQRDILGITFDPNDTSEYPTVYVSHCWLFHGLDVSYNGKVSTVSGPLLDILEHKVTGLPISDHDHGNNGIEFGDNGELYIQIGGSTNAGIPGPLSSRDQQDEFLLSAATLVARNINAADFDGFVTYDDQGNQTSGFGVEVFASGERNPYDIVLHSNGLLYGTDNGPNWGFGGTSISCTEESAEQPKEQDKLNVILKDHYYGHPNRMRGQTDPRQCKWRSLEEEGDDEYTAPIARLPSSTNGICEWQTEHFGGQLRGQLIVGRYLGELRNIKLTNDGMATVLGIAKFPPVLTSGGGLDVTQGPDGTLFVAMYSYGNVIYHAPKEEMSAGLKIKSAFPRRGPKLGGSTLTIYGDNLTAFGPIEVKVGGTDCPVLGPTSDSKITCTLPNGAGTVDIVITAGVQSDVFKNGYRYTNGDNLSSARSPPTPAPVTPPVTPVPTSQPTPVPTPLPTPEPTPHPTAPPTTRAPVLTPTTPAPEVETMTPDPTPGPTSDPTQASTPGPTPAPTALPTTAAPIVIPTTPAPTTHAPVASGSRSSMGIKRLVFINPETNMGFRPVEGCNQCLKDPSMPINIRAETFGKVGSVVMTIVGPSLVTGRVENMKPFALFGDSGGDYLGQVLSPGLYTVTAQAFSAANEMGDESDQLSVVFTV